MTDLFEAENLLNNLPLGFVYDDYAPDVLMPNCLLYGRNLDREYQIVEEIDFEVIEGSDLREKTCELQNIVEHVWLVWYREYIDGLRE